MLWYHASCLAKLKRYPKGCRPTWQPSTKLDNTPKADTGAERNRKEPEELTENVPVGEGLRACQRQLKTDQLTASEN
jgi:hypothetical protein